MPHTITPSTWKTAIAVAEFFMGIKTQKKRGRKVGYDDGT